MSCTVRQISPRDMALTLEAHVIMVDTIFFCVETRDYSGNQNDQKINSSSISDVLGV